MAAEEQGHPALPAALIPTTGMPRGRWYVGFKSPEDQLEEFLARQLPWVREILQEHPPSNEAISALQRPGGFEILGQAQDEYLEVLKRCPAKLREYRKRQAKIAAKAALSRLPSMPPGAPRGMRPGTHVEAERLLRLIAEFEGKNGTRRGAWDYATKKVYGSEDNQRARIERGRQTLRRYKALRAKMVQKPSA